MKNILIALLVGAFFFILYSFNNKRLQQVRYKVESFEDLESLQQRVNNDLIYGWRPTGGIFYGGGQYMQALINDH